MAGRSGIMAGRQQEAAWRQSMAGLVLQLTSTSLLSTFSLGGPDGPAGRQKPMLDSLALLRQEGVCCHRCCLHTVLLECAPPPPPTPHPPHTHTATPPPHPHPPRPALQGPPVLLPLYDQKSVALFPSALAGGPCGERRAAESGVGGSARRRGRRSGAGPHACAAPTALRGRCTVRKHYFFLFFIYSFSFTPSP